MWKMGRVLDGCLLCFLTQKGCPCRALSTVEQAKNRGSGYGQGKHRGYAGANDESFEQALRNSNFEKSPFTAALGNPCGFLRI